MRSKNTKALADKIVKWAKENGKEYSQEIEFKRVRDVDGSDNFVYNYPAEMSKFINKMQEEITSLDNADLRRLEDALLHVPDERVFMQSQMIALNLIRRIVFLEIDKRRNKPPLEPGE